MKYTHLKIAAASQSGIFKKVKKKALGSRVLKKKKIGKIDRMKTKGGLFLF